MCFCAPPQTQERRWTCTLERNAASPARHAARAARLPPPLPLRLTNHRKVYATRPLIARQRSSIVAAACSKASLRLTSSMPQAPTASPPSLQSCRNRRNPCARRPAKVIRTRFRCTNAPCWRSGAAEARGEAPDGSVAPRPRLPLLCSHDEVRQVRQAQGRRTGVQMQKVSTGPEEVQVEKMGHCTGALEVSQVRLLAAGSLEKV